VYVNESTIGKCLVWLIGGVECLHAAQQVQMSVSVGNDCIIMRAEPSNCLDKIKYIWVPFARVNQLSVLRLLNAAIREFDISKQCIV